MCQMSEIPHKVRSGWAKHSLTVGRARRAFQYTSTGRCQPLHICKRCSPPAQWNKLSSRHFPLCFVPSRCEAYWFGIWYRSPKTMANSCRFCNRQLEMQFATYTPERQGSASSTASSDSSPSKSSTPSSSRKSSIRSFSAPFSPSVIIERGVSATPPSDDDIIIAIVRLSSPFRRTSLEPCDDLPSR